MSPSCPAGLFGQTYVGTENQLRTFQLGSTPLVVIPSRIPIAFTYVFSIKFLGQVVLAVRREVRARGSIGRSAVLPPNGGGGHHCVLLVSGHQGLQIRYEVVFACLSVAASQQ